MIRLVLLVLAAICFLALLLGWTAGNLHLLPLGLLLWVLADLFAGTPEARYPWSRRTAT